jgi:type I restriction enzyme M protein
MPKGKKKQAVPQSSAQELGSIIKSCRQIMRKDKGLSTDLDRLPMLTWIMFLKFLDDMENIRQEEYKVAGKRYHPAVETPYRWRDWAAKPDGVTGPELLSFINQDETVRPDGKRGLGLFAYLRSLQSANGDRRDVIARVFKDTVNKSINGYLLRDVINKVNGIHFTSKDEIYTLGHLYESMLREMRDAAGDAGEFYTPRAVVKFIVDAVNPRLGETVLDPAAGTGGFLVAAYEHLRKQAKRAEDYKQLQRSTLHGVEAKPLPYLLCEMNLLLHGVEYPDIDPENALRFPLREIGDRDRVDVIVTNPPFGGEEERGILSNFPEDKKTAETALLFLQLIMRKLRRPVGGAKGGRCGMVVPNGVLFGDGICARIKEELLKEYNLHTIVRLPNGVFAPYTSIPTNLLFFDRTGPTKDVWYYEQPLPAGRKNYTKTVPIQFEEFADCLSWWKKREENERAWKVTASDIVKYDSEGHLVSVNLDVTNPRAKEGITHLPPEQLAASIQEKERRILEIIGNIQTLLGRASS